MQNPLAVEAGSLMACVGQRARIEHITQEKMNHRDDALALGHLLGWTPFTYMARAELSRSSRRHRTPTLEGLNKGSRKKDWEEERSKKQRP